MKRALHSLAVGTAIGTLALIDLFAFTYYYYNNPGPLSQPTTILFRKGTGFRDIVDQMGEKDVIRFPTFFKIIAVTLGDARKFNAGEYRFTAAISPRLVMDMIAEGRVVVHRLTVPEGLTVRQVTALLDREELLEGKVAEDLIEGSLLPQTYHYTYGDLRQELVNRMRAGMETTLAELWEKRKAGLPFTSPAQAVTLASIVERETDVNSERGRIAAVYLNRLKKGMKLQADPTVIYGIEQVRGTLGRPLVLSDLKDSSPYNTYQFPGLPPGPISNPGRASLEAVLNPPDTKELYFVATGTGGHNFSETLTGHNKNVGEYRKARGLAEKAKEPAKPETAKKEPEKKEPAKKEPVKNTKKK